MRSVMIAESLAGAEADLVAPLALGRRLAVVADPRTQADWLMAHPLFNQPYHAAPFALLAVDEAELFGSAAALVAGGLTATRYLARTLVLSGFGMTICGGSYPASQGEHLISHQVDMMADETCPKTLHGGLAAIGRVGGDVDAGELSNDAGGPRMAAGPLPDRRAARPGAPRTIHLSRTGCRRRRSLTGNHRAAQRSLSGQGEQIGAAWRQNLWPCSFISV
jgi:hypothetical protein